MPNILAMAGSSPRVRGKHPGRLRHHHQQRLIPARAGKTSILVMRSANMWAHPRACGENGGEHVGVFVAEGSSPRVRGKHLLEDCADLLDRLIPARAGKTAAE